MFEPEKMRQQIEKPKTNWNIKFAVPIRNLTEANSFFLDHRISSQIQLIKILLFMI